MAAFVYNVIIAVLLHSVNGRATNLPERSYIIYVYR